MIKKSTVILFFLFSATFLFPQEKNKLIITEKADYRVYKNGKYIGLTSRETKSYIVQRSETSNKINYFGEAFVLQKTKSNKKNVAKSIDDVLEIEFSMDLEKEVENPYQPQIFSEDAGYPILRNFPVLPNKAFTKKDLGKKWLGKSTIVVRPIPENPPTRIPVLVEFEYKGLRKYKKESVHFVKAVFGVRYKATDEEGDLQLLRSQGGREVDIYLDLNNKPVFIRENINEEFFYKDNTNIKHKGFLLHFYSYSNFYSDSYICGKTESMQIEPTKNFSVRQSERGTVLNLKNLNFVADSAKLLKGEKSKIAEIVAVLKSVKASLFMLEGHTADTGNDKEERQLSLDRARVIAEELIQQGIPADKIIISGAGASKPIADNASEEGKAKNRRVEITIF